ncbi:DUF3322 and DUF2220 domain-containing protein [Nocardioides sp.]|uniref:Wadjet anti-phage system protein JetD domain-containing protein n=1 Tax=Nocardioides sp. TaxID=35761 RepID=UPI000C94280E|nr:DUF3322 and DUF2220 domain-containing protein [Nocardioides sp.]MAS54700.1 hypothetical protein [Pimelobacter sp.]MDE0776140.1 DUF2220 family protein [Nocardioides sp.]
MAEWSEPTDVAAKVRRRWTSGELLGSYGRGADFEPIEVPLRGPKAGEIGADLGRVQAWATRLERGASGGYDVIHKAIGGRAGGRNEIPARAVVTSYAQAWRLLGVEAEVASYDQILGLTADTVTARAWVLARPHAALGVGEDWPRVLAAREWLEEHRGRGRSMREITAPGVDTKFVERHRAVLAALLDVPVAASGFVAALGLRERPARVRLRFDEEFAGLPASLSEATLRVDQLSAMPISVQRAVIVENEITFLTVPVPREGVVIWGEGFRVNHAGSLPWLRDAPVHYWGDLDTHGFAILDQLRAWLPQTESFLMDAETLHEHRGRWGQEPTPTTAALSRLTRAEQALYGELVTDRHGERLRLEQERIDWEWAMRRWPGGVPPITP